MAQRIFGYRVIERFCSVYLYTTLSINLIYILHTRFATHGRVFSPHSMGSEHMAPTYFATFFLVSCGNHPKYMYPLMGVLHPGQPQIGFSLKIGLFLVPVVATLYRVFPWWSDQLGSRFIGF